MFIINLQNIESVFISIESFRILSSYNHKCEKKILISVIDICNHGSEITFYYSFNSSFLVAVAQANWMVIICEY